MHKARLNALVVVVVVAVIDVVDEPILSRWRITELLTCFFNALSMRPFDPPHLVLSILPEGFVRMCNRKPRQWNDVTRCHFSLIPLNLYIQLIPNCPASTKFYCNLLQRKFYNRLKIDRM